MKNTKLQKMLNHLHDELKNYDNTDPNIEELLLTVNSDIKDLLNNENKKTSYYNTIMKKFNRHLEQFEGTHPEITSILSRIIDELNNMGI
ncbi:MAG: hypothetical protein ACD_79C00896G0001 [uncultured bacterium]|nr:MAG: hypothetical protein ACD_79C00896G0001 [uncultured bacterium]